MRPNPTKALTLGFLTFSLTSPATFGQTASSAGPPLASAAAADNAQAGNLPAVLPNYPGRLGLGLNIGNVLTGVSAKLWAASSVAFQAALGEGADGNNLRSHLDLLFSVGTWTSTDGQYILPAYLGVGGVLAHSFAAGQSPSSTEGGFRLPLGMSILVRGNPVELYFEVAPELTVRSSAAVRGRYGLYLDGAIGARYYF